MPVYIIMQMKRFIQLNADYCFIAEWNKVTEFENEKTEIIARIFHSSSISHQNQKKILFCQTILVTACTHLRKTKNDTWNIILWSKEYEYNIPVHRKQHPSSLTRISDYFISRWTRAFALDCTMQATIQIPGFNESQNTIVSFLLFLCVCVSCHSLSLHLSWKFDIAFNTKQQRRKKKRKHVFNS